jgi:hypothetical protein
MPVTAVNVGKKRTVSYRNAKGRTSNATVIAAGGTSGVKIRVRGLPASTGLIDNVAYSTAKTDTGVVINRYGPD